MVFMNENASYEEVKGNLFVKLINYDKDREDLQETLYILTGDIAETLWYTPNPEASAEYLITEIIPSEILERFIKEAGDLSKVFADAYKNLKPLIAENAFDLALGRFKDPREVKHIDTYESLLFNSNYLFGAACAFIPGLLKIVSKNATNGGDLILSFTSKHEVAIHPLGDKDNIFTPEEIAYCLNETNKEQNIGDNEKNFLTNKLYIYYAALDCIKEYK